MSTVIAEEVNRSVGGCKESLSPLHYLYPGHPMQPSFDITRQNIPNEFEPELSEYVKKEKRLTNFHHQTVNDVEKELGGKHKVFHHPAVAPDMVTENPDTNELTMDLPPALPANPDAPSGQSAPSKGPSKKSSKEGFSHSSTSTPSKRPASHKKSRSSVLGISLVGLLILIIFLGILFLCI